MDSNDLEARARHHHPRQELRRHVRRHAHQHRRHAGPRRFRRRGRARAVDGGQRAAAGRCGRRPDAADALRHAQGAGAGPEAHRRRQQGRPPERAAGLGREPHLRSVRQARRDRGATRFSGDLRLGAARLGGRRHEGCAGLDRRAEGRQAYNMRPLFDAILKHVPVRDDDPDGPLQLQICSLDYSSYVGKIGIGRISRGRIKPLQDVVVMNGPDSQPVKARINQVLTFEGLERVVSRKPWPATSCWSTASRKSASASTICAPEQTRCPAAAEGGRADADHEFHGQQLAARRPRRQVRHQPPDPRAPGARGQEQRRAEGRVHRRIPTRSSSPVAANCT